MGCNGLDHCDDAHCVRMAALRAAADLFLKICTICESIYAVSNSGEWGAPSAVLWRP